MPDLKPGDPGYTGPLKGKEEICRFLNIGDAQFEEILEKGAPIRQIGRTFYSHTKILEEWLCYYCSKSPPISRGASLIEEK